MLFNTNKLKPNIFTKIILIFSLIFFIIVIDYNKSSFIKGKIKIVSNSYSTNLLFSKVAQSVFNKSVFDKVKFIDILSEKYFKNSNFFNIIERNINDIYLKFNDNLNKKNFIKFKKQYIKLNNKTNIPLFGITPIHSIFKIDKYGGNLPAPKNEIEINVCQNEWETTQIILVPFVDSIVDVEIKINKNKYLLYNNIECFSGEYAFCNNSNYYVDKTGWFADPLFPMELDTSAENYIRFKMPELLPTLKYGEVKSLWLNYFIPANIRPGKYDLQIEVIAKTNNINDTAKVSIKLNVFDFTLPSTMHLKTAFSFDKKYFLNYYNVAQISKEIDKKHYSFYLKYHLNPVALYTSIDYTYPPIEDWQWCVNHGANFFNLTYLDHEIDTILLDNFIIKLKNKIKYLKKYNLLKYAYIYGFDEVKPANYNSLKKMVNIIRTVDNKIPFMSTVKPNEELKNYIDIWVVLTSDFSENTKIYYDNQELWWYICCIPYQPYPNFFIEYPAIAPRIIFWQASKYNIDGFLYYLINSWVYNQNTEKLTKQINPFAEEIKKGNKWPSVPWCGHSFRWNEGQRFYNGDGQLVYPGHDTLLYPSIRLINIRDGIEDYECFYQLKLLVKKYRKEGKINFASTIEKFLNYAYMIVPSNKNYLNDPDRLLQIKKETLELLEKLNQ